eukprot:5966554-Amphidinium_carterae.2
MDDNMGVKSNKPTRPPPADANPGFLNSAGEWIEDDYVAAPRPPPPGAKPGRWNSDGEWVDRRRSHLHLRRHSRLLTTRRGMNSR